MYFVRTSYSNNGKREKMKYFFVQTNLSTEINPPPKSIRIRVGAKREFRSSVFSLFLTFYFIVINVVLSLMNYYYL